MLKFVNYSIVFQEIPGEITLAINLSNCPNRCQGCHSPHLRSNIGKALNETALDDLLKQYGQAITCVCLMGGDANPQAVEQLATLLRRKTAGRLKFGWYSGKNSFPVDCSLENFDYVKLGAYIEHLGGLNSSTTNQRFFHVDNGEMIDRTDLFLSMNAVRL